MLQIVKSNLAKLSNYPRLRIFLIIAAIIVVFLITMNLLSPSNVKNAAPPSNVQAVNSQGAKTQKTAPQSQAAQYQQLSNTDQSQAEQQAIQSGGSVFQNATTPIPSQSGTTGENDQSNSAVSPSQFIASKNQNTPPSQSDNSTTNDQLSQQIETLQSQLNQQQQLSAQQQSQAQQQQANAHQEMQNIQSSMQSGLQNITDSWKIPTLATVQGAAPPSNSSGGAAQGPVSIKAGTIVFGVISTALSSDSPGTPVLASIVSGPYRGAKLLGGFTSTKDALVIQFNLMTLPYVSSSIGINAYAIDSKTANNALATNVNNHYFLRYGMLFASAFLQGFGNAYSATSYCPNGSQNCSVISTNGSNTLPNNGATLGTAAYQGLGQIGTSLGQVAAQQFNTPPTITVAQGTGIGVLFMSDVRIPTN